MSDYSRKIALIIKERIYKRKRQLLEQQLNELGN
jgi:hypothetical protein